LTNPIDMQRQICRPTLDGARLLVFGQKDAGGALCLVEWLRSDTRPE
jgi:hypothetical protein